MLNSTQAMAGMIGSNSANPRLSPSAISAICCAAKAASHELRVEKIAPAMAVPAASDDESVGFDETVRPFGRFCMESGEVGFVAPGLMLLLGELMLKHLALSTAVVAIAAAIDADD